jgi:hypothetical protein
VGVTDEAKRRRTNKMKPSESGPIKPSGPREPVGPRNPLKGVGDKKGMGDMYPESGNWQAPEPF